MEIGTPTLLLGAISLLLLTYTSRFFTISKLIRDLYDTKKNEQKSVVNSEIVILRKRVELMKKMLIFAAISYLLCTASILPVLFKITRIGEVLFTLNICALLISLVFALREIFISTKALNIILDNAQTKK